MSQTPEVRAAMHAAYNAAYGFMRDRAVMARSAAADYRVHYGHSGRHADVAEIADELATEFASWAAMKAPVEIKP